MSNELQAAIIGGAIGIAGGLFTALLIEWCKTKRSRLAITNAIRAQLDFTKDKLERFQRGDLTRNELSAGRPLYQSLADNLGYLSPEQAKLSTKALLMYFEFAEGEKHREEDERVAHERTRDEARANKVKGEVENALREFEKRWWQFSR